MKQANTMRPKFFQGYVVLLLMTTLSKFQFWNHCDQAADMLQIDPSSRHYHMDLGFAIPYIQKYSSAEKFAIFATLGS